MFAIAEKTDIIVPSKIYSMTVGERLYVLSPLPKGFTAWGVLTHCFIVNRYIAAWTHAGGIIIFLFLLGWNFHCCIRQIKQGRTDMGSCTLLAGTVGTITQSRKIKRNSRRHGCVDIGIALVVFSPSSKTIGELTSYIISY